MDFDCKCKRAWRVFETVNVKILIVKLGAAGDVLRTTALAEAIANRYKNSQIDWLTEESMAELLVGNSRLRNVFYISEPEKWLGQHYDLIINLDADYEISHAITEMKPKRIIGTYTSNGELLYTKDSSYWFDMSLLSKHGKEKADLLKANNRKSYQKIWHDIIGLSDKKHRPHFPLDARHRKFASSFARYHGIKPKNRVIAVNTGAGQRWLHKKLGIADTVRLLNHVNNREPENKILLMGGPTEALRNFKIRRQAPFVIDATTRSMRELASMIYLCDTLITTDSLPLHIGTALGKKVIAFFSPTSPWEIELYDNGAKVLPTKGCLACYHHKCPRPPQYDLKNISELI